MLDAQIGITKVMMVAMPLRTTTTAVRAGPMIYILLSARELRIDSLRGNARRRMSLERR